MNKFEKIQRVDEIFLPSVQNLSSTETIIKKKTKFVGIKTTKNTFMNLNKKMHKNRRINFSIPRTTMIGGLQVI